MIENEDLKSEETGDIKKIKIEVKLFLDDEDNVLPKILIYPESYFNNKKVNVKIRDKNSGYLIQEKSFIFNVKRSDYIYYWITLDVMFKDVDGLIIDVSEDGMSSNMMCQEIVSYTWINDKIDYGNNTFLDNHILDINRLVDQAYVIGMLQAKKEITDFCNFIKDKKIKNILEIGSDKGATFYLWCKLSDKNGKKISLDLPHGGFGSHDFNIEKRNERMKLWSDNVHIVEGDSHKEDTLLKIKSILEGEKLDLLFIDGDHTYEGVKKDYEMYKDLVKDEGYIAFHDIKDDQYHRDLGCFVNQFWEEINGDKKEFCNEEPSGGIGCIIHEDEEKNIDDDNIIVMGAWASTEERIKNLIKNIEKIRSMTKAKILLSSHFPVSQEVQNMVDYYIFDKNNPLISYRELHEMEASIFWFYFNNNYRINIKNNKSHDYAVYLFIRNAFHFAKYLGKKNIYFTEADWGLHKDLFDDFFNKNILFYDVCLIEGSKTFEEGGDFSYVYQTGIFSIKVDKACEIFSHSFLDAKDFYRSMINDNVYNLEEYFSLKVNKMIEKDKIYVREIDHSQMEINKYASVNNGTGPTKFLNDTCFYAIVKDPDLNIFVFLKLVNKVGQIFYLKYKDYIQEISPDIYDFDYLYKINYDYNSNDDILLMDGNNNILVLKNKEDIMDELDRSDIDFY